MKKTDWTDKMLAALVELYPVGPQPIQLPFSI